MISNNHGWSLKEMIVLSAILIMALMVATYHVMKFSKGVKDNSLTGNYIALENQVTAATEAYLQEYYGKITSSLVISTDNLISYGFLSSDSFSNSNYSCKGYALVNGYNQEEYSISSYIKCNQYETENYESWRLDAS